MSPNSYVRKAAFPFLLSLAFFWMPLAGILKSAAAETSPDFAPLRAWLATQQKIHSVSADFTQIRSFKTLKSPLSIKGHFWFSSPDRFRWQLGDPPKTILIGTEAGMLIIQPFRKHAEKKPPASSGSFSSAGPMGMMGFSGAHTLEEFQKKMRVLSLKTSGTRCHLEMLPRDPAATAELASISFDFDTVSGQWLGFEIVTREGSSILTTFSNGEVNARIDPGLFVYDLTGFTVEDEKK